MKLTSGLAVLGILISANQPLFPREVSNELNIPRSSERDIDNQGTSYPTVRDSLFRLLSNGKIGRNYARHPKEYSWYPI